MYVGAWLSTARAPDGVGSSLVDRVGQVHPHLGGLEELALEVLVGLGVGPGLGQQDLDPLVVGSLPGGDEELPAGLGHEVLDLVDRVLALWDVWRDGHHQVPVAIVLEHGLAVEQLQEGEEGQQREQ